jgi:O-antigen/teichoic acid export membrane protein
VNETRRTIAGGILLVGAATMLANGASYLLSMFAARWMSVPQYGGLGALLSISIIGGTLALGVQAVGARRVAAHRAAGGGVSAEEERSAVLALGLRLTAVVAVGGLAVSWPLAVLLDVPVPAVVLTFLAVAASVTGFGALGLVQGDERHRHYGSAYAAIGCLRAAGGVVALAIRPEVTSACVGILAGSLAGTVAAILIAGPSRLRRRLTAQLGREFAATTGSLIALYALSNTDLLLARSYLDGDASGEYALGSLVAKIAFFLPYAVITVFFPKMSAGTLRHAFELAVGASAAIGAVATIGAALLGGPLVWLIGGDKYAGFAALAWLFALEGTLFAILQVILYAGFSSRARSLGILTACALVVQVVVVSFWVHQSVAAIVVCTCVIAATLVVVGIMVELRRTRSRDASAQSPGLVGSPRQ